MEKIEEKEKNNQKIKKRIWEIDFLRGLAIILMVLDHFTYDFASFYSFFSNSNSITPNPAFASFINFCQSFQVSSVRQVLHYIFANLFFLLVGVSSCFSKNNWKRGFLVLLCGLVMDGATFLVYYVTNGTADFRMLFNVLVSLGCCILITALILKLPYEKWILLILAIIVIGLGIGFNLYNPRWISNLEFKDVFLISVGLKAWGSDCFSIVPYIGATFLGAFLGKTIYKEKKSILPRLDSSWNKPVCFVGRHTIFVYLGHQVVLIAFLLIVGLCFGYRVF